MGWGAKKSVAPLRPKLHGDEPIADAKERKLEISDAPDAGRAAEIEFMRLQANKGWTAERRYDVLRDFVRTSGLYLELNKFVQRQR